MSPHSEFTQLQWADGDSLQPRDLVPDARQHATNLAVAAFGQYHF